MIYLLDDIISFFCAVILPGCLLLGALLVFVNFFEQRSCNIYSEVTGKQTKYRQFDYCYIETDKGFQRLDEYKARIIASEGLAD